MGALQKRDAQHDKFISLRSGEVSAWCVWHLPTHAHDTVGHRTRSHDVQGRTSQKPIWTLPYKDIDATVVKAEEVSGPPVELGAEERQAAVGLSKWWFEVTSGEDQEAVLDGDD